MRYSSWLAIVIVIFCLWSGFTYLHFHNRQIEAEQQLKLRRQFQKAVGLPNLAITSAARYLRHYSITDLATPFQDYPASPDHFPAGFAFAPPDYSNMPCPIVFGKPETHKGANTL
jgi:hypothetical protein